MSAAERPANSETGGRLLVIGQSPLVLESVTNELRALGFTVEGTTQPEKAATAFDARVFDLVALGGGIPHELRSTLRTSFSARNPAVRVLDTYAPIAVTQIVDALQGESAADAVDLDAYCARIGYHGPLEPTLETLRALHERHPDAIVFEAIDVLLDRGVDLSPKSVDAKLIGAGRGGYCFEQNSLFKRVLEAIGFKVDGLAARVKWNKPAGTPVSARTHMALKVTIDGTPWLADVGFGGCVMTAPLRMDTPAPQPTQHETFRIFPYGPALLVQIRRNERWLPAYELSGEIQYEPDYALANWFTATHPSSHFRHNLIAARTTSEARYGLLNRQLTIRRPDGATQRQVLDARGLETALTEVFRLPVAADWRHAIDRAALAEN